MLIALTLPLGMVAATSLTPSSLAQESQTMVYAASSVPLFDGPKGKVMGSIPPGTPMVQLETKRSRVKVFIEAWSRSYAPLRLVADPSSLTLRAELVRIPDGVREVSDRTVDRYSARWEEVRLTAWVPAKSLVSNVREVWRAARKLQHERCTVCHEFKQPELLTPSQWRGTLVIMGHRASLTPEEHALLSQYLETKARTD